jgi:hypothetical protein
MVATDHIAVCAALPPTKSTTDSDQPSGRRASSLDLDGRADLAALRLKCSSEASLESGSFCRFASSPAASSHRHAEAGCIETAAAHTFARDETTPLLVSAPFPLQQATRDSGQVKMSYSISLDHYSGPLQGRALSAARPNACSFPTLPEFLPPLDSPSSIRLTQKRLPDVNCQLEFPMRPP